MYIKPLIVGQAPSAQGDGHPFTGPSGKTLCTWLGVPTRALLLEHFDVTNLYSRPIVPWQRTEDHHREWFNGFSVKEARVFAIKIMDDRSALGLAQRPQIIPRIILLGGKVAKCFGLPKRVEMLQSWAPDDWSLILTRFPHPSGLNRQLNEPEFLEKTSRQLRMIAGMMTRD